MDTPTKVIVNCETGESEIIPLTPEEIASLEIARAEAAAQAEAEAAEAAAKALQKETVLKALAEAAGLTVEEVKIALN